jgi:hypothetical protein
MLKQALENMTTTPPRFLSYDRAGCSRGDCPLRSSCWRYVGDKLRQDPMRGDMAMFDPGNCESYWEMDDA